MAEHPQEQEQEVLQSVAKLATEIVVAYVTRNIVAPTDLSDLIGAVARALGALGREQAEPVKPEPAVPVRRSIHDDHLVCLVCGKQQKSCGAISTSRTNSRRKPTASCLGSSPTTPWPRRATRGSVPRWPSAPAWGATCRHRDELAGGRRRKNQEIEGHQPALWLRRPRSSMRSRLCSPLWPTETGSALTWPPPSTCQADRIRLRASGHGFRDLDGLRA